ncbi:MAG: HlyD family efflux transporter periplasmic adaptor subunit, partial [Anaerolineae bacterium]
KAQYDAMAAGPRAQEIAAAQAGLDAAQAGLARLEDGARPEEIAAAEAALAAARASLQRLYEGPGEETRIAAEAELANAQAALRQAQAAYDPVAERPDVAMLPQSLQLEQATNAYEAAKAQYDAMFADPDADLVAGAQAQIKQAQANLERLRKPATASEIAEAEAMVRQAQARLELLQAGSRAEELAAAAAAVDQARAGLELAQASLADTELRAPFAGTVALLAVRSGEQVVAGAPVAQLADLAAWQVETDDLTELDVVGIEAGDGVEVTVDAIPGLSLPGTVVRVKPLGVEKLGDVTYTVVVALDRQDARLRWNMTAVVSIP